MRQFPTLLTMSREEAEAFVAGPRDVCISIRCPATREAARVSANYRAVLRLAFDDIPWTDVPCPEGALQITEAIADDVVRFVAANLDARRLVVHCVAGASRSVSMAMALAKSFTGEDWRPRFLVGFDLRGRPAPNPNVYYAIVAAYERRMRRPLGPPPGPPSLDPAKLPYRPEPVA